MEKSRIVQLFYGYLVCLVAIIVSLTSISMLIGAIFNLQDPLRANSYQFMGANADLSSYEAYKIDILTGRNSISETKEANPAVTYQPSDVELRAAYDSAKENRIASVKLDANRAITNSILLLLVSAFLFVTHWRWVNRLNK